MTGSWVSAMADSDNGDRTYSEILRLDALRTVAHVDEGRQDLMFFLVSHQICELWFSLILQHLETAKAALLAERPADAVSSFGRLPMLVRILVAQFDALTTLSAESFDEIRAELGSASGIQSAGFREIEILCGLRDGRFPGTSRFSETERARLRARLAEVSVADAYEGLAKRMADRPRREADERDMARLRAALLEFDESVVLWRARHASLAERLIGGRVGTGGSDGASYLWRATQRRLFPMAWPTGH